MKKKKKEEKDKALVLVPDVDCVITAKELITLLEECPQYQLIHQHHHKKTYWWWLFYQ